MSKLYQKDLIFVNQAEQRREAGRLTRKKIHELKNRSADTYPEIDPLTRISNAASTIFCLLFRPRFIDPPPPAARPVIRSAKTC